MTGPAYFHSMIDYTEWANGVLYDAVAELPEEEIVKERPNLFGTILRTLTHLVVADRIWLAHMNGVPHGFDFLRPDLFENFTELRAVRRETDKELADYVGTLDDAALAEIVDYELIGGNQGSLSRAMILTHIVTHGNFHRGFVCDMFGQIPARPPIMDIPVYERAVREDPTRQISG